MRIVVLHEGPNSGASMEIVSEIFPEKNLKGFVTRILKSSCYNQDSGFRI